MRYITDNINDYDLHDLSIKLNKERADRRDHIIHKIKIDKTKLHLYDECNVVDGNLFNGKLFRTINCGEYSSSYNYKQLENILFAFVFGEKLEVVITDNAYGSTVNAVLNHLYNQKEMYISEIDGNKIIFGKADDNKEFKMEEEKEIEEDDKPCTCNSVNMHKLWVKKQNDKDNISGF